MVKKIVKRVLHQAGWDLHRLTASGNSEYQLLKCVDRVGVDLIFDIGANVGQFAQKMRSVGYRGEIVSFEPLSTAHRVLCKKASLDPKWHVYARCAIGDRDGEIDINVSGRSASSSVLPMLDAHSTASPNSKYVAVERSDIARLDSVAARYLRLDGRYFLKIDTQGFEWEVLDGAEQTLRGARGLMCELSLVPLYKGQRLWRDIITRLEKEGFVFWAIQKAFTDPRDGRSLQVDAIFLRLDD